MRRGEQYPLRLTNQLAHVLGWSGAVAIKSSGAITVRAQLSVEGTNSRSWSTNAVTITMYVRSSGALP